MTNNYKIYSHELTETDITTVVMYYLFFVDFPHIFNQV